MIYRAIVADVRDPSDRGRIKVMIPALTGQSISEWIWPIVPNGYLVLPTPGDQVWVLFENGDRDVPVWIGGAHPKPEADVLNRLADLEQRLSTLEQAV